MPSCGWKGVPNPHLPLRHCEATAQRTPEFSHRPQKKRDSYSAKRKKGMGGPCRSGLKAPNMRRPMWKIYTWDHSPTWSLRVGARPSGPAHGATRNVLQRQRDGILVQMLTEARVEEVGKWRQESYLGGGISKCRWLVRKGGQRDLPGGNLGGRWWVWARGVCVCVCYSKVGIQLELNI